MMKKQLYLIPGLMCTEKLWNSIQPLLKEDFELIHIPIPLCNNLDDMVERLKKTLPNEPINLLGFSLGGYIASYFTVQASSRVKQLMVMSASCCDLPLHEIQKRQSMFTTASKTTIKGLSKKKILSLLDEKYHNNEEIINCVASMYKQLGQAVFKQQIQATLYRKDLSKGLSFLDNPLCFVYSRNDVLVNKNWIQNIKNNRTILKEHESASHMLPLEEPKYCAKSITEFFS